jgi:hypothetical protein
MVSAEDITPEPRIAETNLERIIMKSRIQSVAVVAALALPAVCFAQSVPPASGADENVQSVQFEEVAYVPVIEQSPQPATVQPAQADAAKQAGKDSYGGVADSTSSTGAAFSPAYDVGMKSIYLRH